MRPANPRVEGYDPAEWQLTTFHGAPGSGVEPLPALVGTGGVIRTEWELSFEERGAILDGARVVVTFLGRMPPVSLSVEGVNS
jgi:hypothetical protein